MVPFNLLQQSLFILMILHARHMRLPGVAGEPCMEGWARVFQPQFFLIVVTQCTEGKPRIGLNYLTFSHISSFLTVYRPMLTCCCTGAEC